MSIRGRLTLDLTDSGLIRRVEADQLRCVDERPRSVLVGGDGLRRRWHCGRRAVREQDDDDAHHDDRKNSRGQPDDPLLIAVRSVLADGRRLCGSRSPFLLDSRGPTHGFSFCLSKRFSLSWIERE
jgi:hypothetical protein